MLSDMTLREILSKTASDSPVPGGGSMAALMASISTSLVEMVVNVTLHKNDYADVHEEMAGIVEKLDGATEKFLKAIDADAGAYQGVLNAYRQPKETDEEISARKKSIQDALKNAAAVPLEVAVGALEIMKLAQTVVEKGNKNALTDGAVAAMAARTAILSSLYNSKINILSIEDQGFIKKVTEDIEKIESQAILMEKKIISVVNSGLK